MRRAILVLLISLLAVLLSSCSDETPELRERELTKFINGVKLGMLQEDVYRIMNEPFDRTRKSKEGKCVNYDLNTKQWEEAPGDFYDALIIRGMRMPKDFFNKEMSSIYEVWQYSYFWSKKYNQPYCISLYFSENGKLLAWAYDP